MREKYEMRERDMRAGENTCEQSSEGKYMHASRGGDGGEGQAHRAAERQKGGASLVEERRLWWLELGELVHSRSPSIRHVYGAKKLCKMSTTKILTEQESPQAQALECAVAISPGTTKGYHEDTHQARKSPSARIRWERGGSTPPGDMVLQLPSANEHTPTAADASGTVQMLERIRKMRESKYEMRERDMRDPQHYVSKASVSVEEIHAYECVRAVEGKYMRTYQSGGTPSGGKETSVAAPTALRHSTTHAPRSTPNALTPSPTGSRHAATRRSGRRAEAALLRSTRSRSQMCWVVPSHSRLPTPTSPTPKNRTPKTQKQKNRALSFMGERRKREACGRRRHGTKLLHEGLGGGLGGGRRGWQLCRGRGWI
ncbi:hypothetical protein C8R45DRAFT_1145751 [Mycena sanguinolenta]|nr:hypothetical protein C8R45DRAFT_1145751 [Mycena sanguinolenta]